MAREEGEGGSANDTDKGMLPCFAFATLRGHPKLSSQEVAALKGNAEFAMEVGQRFSSFCRWGDSDVAIGRALIAWGRGGDASSAAASLKIAAKTAEQHKMFFTKGLADLYCAVML